MKINVLQLKISQANLNIRELCKLAEISTPTLYHMIKTNDTHASNIEKLARVLKFPVQELFDDDVQQVQSVLSVASEPSAGYATTKKQETLHVGKIIEARMKRIKVSVKDIAEATGTTMQNISQMLGRKSIAFEKAVEINAILNPPGSPEWDIFSFYSRQINKSIEQRYVELLEEHKKMQSDYLKLLEKLNKSTD